jgi:hypothetical protein
MQDQATTATRDSWATYSAAREGAIERIVALIKRVEDGGEPYDAVRPEMLAALGDIVGKRPTSITDEERAEAARLIAEVEAARAAREGVAR